MAHHVEPTKIYGAEHPEQIPDKLAWSLYFGAVSESPNPKPSEIARQKAKLRSAHLADPDIAQAARVLVNFHVKSKDIDARLAEAVSSFERTGVAVNHSAFMSERQALVDNTHSSLKELLSASGMAYLEAHIRDEKRFMTAFVDPTDGGQLR